MPLGHPDICSLIRYNPVCSKLRPAQRSVFWFAKTIWETIKQLFPDHIEADWKDGRSHYRGV